MPGRLQQAETRAANVRKRQTARLAQLVSEGVGINAAGERIGLTRGQTARTWANIKAALGEQAR